MPANDKATRQVRNQDDSETPRYKLTEPAYIDDILYEAGAVISYAGVPGYHMEPENAAAEAMKEKHPSKYVDPILEMTDMKVVDTSASTLADLIAQAIAKSASARA
jgi:hypothetical protein